MKAMKKMQQRLQQGKKDNKGFSLVELIIVIAIMAILVGIVGTQVLPYLNRSRQAKDQQILDAFSTAAVSAYSMNAENIDDNSNLTIVLSSKGSYSSSDSGENALEDTIWELAGYDSIGAISWSSTAGKNIKAVQITYTFVPDSTDTDQSKRVEVIGLDKTNGGADVGIDEVKSQL